MVNEIGSSVGAHILRYFRVICKRLANLVRLGQVFQIMGEDVRLLWFFVGSEKQLNIFKRKQHVYSSRQLGTCYFLEIRPLTASVRE